MIIQVSAFVALILNSAPGNARLSPSALLRVEGLRAVGREAGGAFISLSDASLIIHESLLTTSLPLFDNFVLIFILTRKNNAASLYI